MVFIEGEDTMFRSCRECSLDELHMCIRSGFDVNTKGNRGMTPLMYAAISNFSEGVNCLIHHGAIINMKDDIGFTALKYAEQNQNDEVISILGSDAVTSISVVQDENREDWEPSTDTDPIFRVANTLASDEHLQRINTLMGENERSFQSMGYGRQIQLRQNSTPQYSNNNDRIFSYPRARAQNFDSSGVSQALNSNVSTYYTPEIRYSPLQIHQTQTPPQPRVFNHGNDLQTGQSSRYRFRSSDQEVYYGGARNSTQSNNRRASSNERQRGRPIQRPQWNSSTTLDILPQIGQVQTFGNQPHTRNVQQVQPFPSISNTQTQGEDYTRPFSNANRRSNISLPLPPTRQQSQVQVSPQQQRRERSTGESVLEEEVQEQNNDLFNAFLGGYSRGLRQGTDSSWVIPSNKTMNRLSIVNPSTYSRVRSLLRSEAESTVMGSTNAVVQPGSPSHSLNSNPSDALPIMDTEGDRNMQNQASTSQNRQSSQTQSLNLNIDQSNSRLQQILERFPQNIVNDTIMIENMDNQDQDDVQSNNDTRRISHELISNTSGTFGSLSNDSSMVISNSNGSSRNKPRNLNSGVQGRPSSTRTCSRPFILSGNNQTSNTNNSNCNAMGCSSEGNVIVEQIYPTHKNVSVQAEQQQQEKSCQTSNTATSTSTSSQTQTSCNDVRISVPTQTENDSTSSQSDFRVSSVGVQTQPFDFEQNNEQLNVQQQSHNAGVIQHVYWLDSDWQREISLAQQLLVQEQANTSHVN